MLNAMYIATTAMRLNNKTNDITSNNLANANTTGYKKDIAVLESFPEVLLAKINDRPDMDNHKAFTGVKVENPEEDVYSLNINTGYFRVITPGGRSHNRDIQFMADDDGFLKTFFRDVDGEKRVNDENYVIGSNGQPIRVQGGNFEVNPNGNVVSNNQVVGNLLFFPGREIIGTTNAGVKLDKIITDYSDGGLINTGNELDFAIQGEGFFKVQDPDGSQYYTRDGSFTLDLDGTLITKDGKTVLGTNGPLNLSGTEVRVTADGRLSIDGQPAGQLLMVQVANKEDLRKIGSGLYRAVENAVIDEQPFTGQVVNEFIEGSNVDTIKEMVGMITGFRSYESSQKIINTQDELLGKVVNELGKV